MKSYYSDIDFEIETSSEATIVDLETEVGFKILFI